MYYRYDHGSVVTAHSICPSPRGCPTSYRCVRQTQVQFQHAEHRSTAVYWKQQFGQSKIQNVTEFVVEYNSRHLIMSMLLCYNFLDFIGLHNINTDIFLLFIEIVLKHEALRMKKKSYLIQLLIFLVLPIIGRDLKFKIIQFS